MREQYMRTGEGFLLVYSIIDKNRWVAISFRVCSLIKSRMHARAFLPSKRHFNRPRLAVVGG